MNAVQVRDEEIRSALRQITGAQSTLKNAWCILHYHGITVAALESVSKALPALDGVGDQIRAAQSGIHQPNPALEGADPKALIFLDLDGVVNSREFDRKPEVRAASELWPDAFKALGSFKDNKEDPGFLDTARCLFDTEAIERINIIWHETDAQIVLSTSWRYRYDLPMLTALLQAYGLKAPIIGTTPQIRGPRGTEILDWVQRYAPHNPPWIALDDLKATQMWPPLRVAGSLTTEDINAVHRQRLVHTDEAYGLTDDDITAAIHLLIPREDHES